MSPSNSETYQNIQDALDKNPMLKALFDVPFAGIALLSEDGILLHCNHSFEDMLGYHTGDLVHGHFNKFVQAEDWAGLTENIPSLFAKKTTTIAGEIGLIGKEAHIYAANYQAKLVEILPEQSFVILYFSLNPILNQKNVSEKSKSASIYETIFDRTSEAIIITDAKSDGRVPNIIYVNQAFCTMSGYEAHECIGNQPSMLTGTETNLSELIRLGEYIKKEKEGVFELYNYKKDGTPFWIQFSILPIKNDAGICTNWVAFEKDITQQKNQHAQLVESETKFRSLVQNSAVGIYILDNEGFSFVNHKFCEITGYTADELVKIQLPKLIFPIDYLMVNKKIQDSLFGLTPTEQYEFRAIKKTGEVRWFETNGSRIILNGNPSIIGIISDTTERKESEEKVRIFSQAIEQSAASIIITNLASEIEYVNPAFIKISGYQKSEIIGQNPRILKTEFNEKNAHKEMWECLERNESWRGVFYNKRKNGEHFWEQVVISPVFNAAGKKTNYVAVKDDITQKIQLENEKEKLIEELTVSLNDLKQFSFITSHNLRAPVTNLVGILDLLDATKIQDEETLELLEGFKKSTLKLNETLEDLIETLIIKSNKNILFKEISFEEIFTATCHSLAKQISEKNTKIVADFSEAPQHLMIKTYIESIFQNIITNAIKYAQPNLAPEITIKSYLHNGKVVLRFSDNGMGMNLEKIKDRLFGLYQKFHNNHDSKGIGLFLVKSHVHAMNGQIELTSKINQGTTITITFDNKDYA